MKDATPSAIHLEDYKEPYYLIDETELSFDLGEESTVVTSMLKMRHNTAHDSGEPLVLQGEQLELLSVSIDGRQLEASEYRVTETELIVEQVPENFQLSCVTRIQPHLNTAFEGLYKSSTMFCTQCEAEGFRRITYYPDRPDIMSVFTVTITADKAAYPVLLSNGNPAGEGELEDGRHWAKWDDPFPKPCYLFALAAGPLEYIESQYTTMHGRDVRCRIYVEPHNIDKCDFALRSLEKSMQWDEETFGREYDLDVYNIVAVDDFNMGAMENKGLNIFNSKYVLALPQTATDTDFINIEGVIGHEYFHNWSGNRVTCRDWFQLTLKEGLTVFRDQQFTADLNAATPKRIDDVNILRTAQFAEDAGPMAHPIQPDSYVEINNFYTVTVYNKGAEVIRMIHTLLGKKGFRRGMDLYFERHDGRAVTTEDFIVAMEDANDADLGQFRRWYHQAGTPRLSVIEYYDAVMQEYVLTLSQQTAATPEQDTKQPFVIPVRCGLISAAGEQMPVGYDGVKATDHVLQLTEAKQRFTFSDVAERPVLSMLRDFSAPVKVEFDRSDEELAFLMANDSDEFNRWDSGQTLGCRLIMSLIEAQRSGEAMQLPDFYVDSIRKVATDEDLDKALAARMLAIPSWSYVAEMMETIAVDEIHAAREFIYAELSARLDAEWLEIYQRNRSGEYTLDPDAMAQRFLGNIALAYLCYSDEPAHHELALSQFEAANNMTDQQAAFTNLVHRGSDHADQVVASFYDRWQHDQLVIDKWFMIQSTAPHQATYARVRELLDHDDFHITNPNRVRSCLGAYCAGNPVAFHNIDGSGYRLLAEYVEKLDKTNPQVASRMTVPLTRWRRYDDTRQALIRGCLDDLKSVEGLSRDVYELVDKSLK